MIKARLIVVFLIGLALGGGAFFLVPSPERADAIQHIPPPPEGYVIDPQDSYRAIPLPPETDKKARAEHRAKQLRFLECALKYIDRVRIDSAMVVVNHYCRRKTQY